MSRGAVGCRSSDRCRILELIIALNDLSLSGAGRGAVLSDSVCVYALSGSINLLFGDVSRGLCSSRIDFVLDNKLNGFGLLFLMMFVFEEEGGGSIWESRETSDLAGLATGRRFVDRSLLDSIHQVLRLAQDIWRGGTEQSHTSSISFL